MHALGSIEGALPPLLDAAVRGAIVLLVALALTVLLHRRSASARHAIWAGAIVVQLLLLALALWGPRWRVATPAPLDALVPVSQADVGVSATTSGNASPAPSASAATSTPTSAPVSTPTLVPAQRPAPISHRAFLFTLWAVGTLVVLLRLAIGTMMVARLARRGERVDDGQWLSLAQRLATTLHIQRPLILLRGDRIGVPITWGIVYPIVLLPHDADCWPEERRRFVLVHEMAHVKRFDALTQLVGQVVLALFWFNPLVWIANRRMQLEREHACDDYVLRHGTQPSQYANDLLEMVLALGTPSRRGAQPAFAALAMARRSEFEGRVLAILDPVLDRHPLNRGRTFMSALASLLIIVPLAALQPYRSAAQSQSQIPAAQVQASSSVDSSSTRSPAATADAHTAVLAEHEPLTAGLEKLNGAHSALGSHVDGMTHGMTIHTSGPYSITGSDDSCESARFGGSDRTSTRSHANDDASSRDAGFLDVGPGHCLEARMRGQFTLTANEDNVSALGASSRVYLRERTGRTDRAVSFTNADGSGVAREYRLNGALAPFDDAARQWLAAALPSVLAEMEVNVGPRVARWRAEGGVDGALRHIVALGNSGARRAHYETLISEGKLSPAELDRVVRSASATMRSSSSDLRAVLSRAAPSVKLSKESMPALESAITEMGSSADKSYVLGVYGQTDDRDMLLGVMRVSETVGSSDDHSRLLQMLAKRYLTKNDRVLETSYFHSVKQIGSSSDLRKTLLLAVPYAARSTEITHHIIDASREIASSDDQSAVLISLVTSGAVSTKTLRDEFFDVTNTVGSSADRSRVLQAAAAAIR